MPKSNKKRKNAKKVLANPKMKTSADVIQRLRWNRDDPRFQFEKVVIGYKDFRFKRGCSEWELKTFRFMKEGGNIPEHAIEYIRDDYKILWNKAERYDLVFKSGKTEKLLERDGEMLWDGKLPKKKKEFRKAHDPPDSSDEEDDFFINDNEDDDDAEDEHGRNVVADPLVMLAEAPVCDKLVVGMTVISSEDRIGVLERFINKTKRWRVRDAEGQVFKASNEHLKPHVSASLITSPSDSNRPKRKRRLRSELIKYRPGCKFKKARMDNIAETVAIIESGCYVSNEREYDISKEIECAVTNSEFIPIAAFKKPKLCPLDTPTRILHVNHSTLQCVAWFARNGIKNPFVLNFASAKQVGGGWKKGALAQEEAICRCSALDACLSSFMDEYYTPHRSEKNALYSHRMIYSPGVPIFRNDFLELQKPLYCSILTSAAPNKKHYLKDKLGKPAIDSASREVQKAMYERCRRVLHIAAHKGYQNLILGAWGCGVFGHERFEVGAIWAELFNTEFQDVFDTVVFAHLVWSELQWNDFRQGLETHLIIEELEFRTADVEPWSRIEWGSPQRPDRYSARDDENLPQRRKRKKGKRGRKY